MSALANITVVMAQSLEPFRSEVFVNAMLAIVPHGQERLGCAQARVLRTRKREKTMALYIAIYYYLLLSLSLSIYIYIYMYMYMYIFIYTDTVALQVYIS